MLPEETLSFYSQLTVAAILFFALKFAWILVQAIQILTHLRRVDIWPFNAQSAIKILNSAITLDIITTPVLKWGFEWSGITFDESTERLQRMGIENPKVVLLAFGVFSLVLIALTVMTIAYKLLICFNAKQWLIDQLRSQLVYSAWLRYMIVSNLKLTSQSLTYLLVLQYEPEMSSPLVTVLNYGFLTLIVAWPIWVACWLRKWQGRMDSEEFTDKFGTLLFS